MVKKILILKKLQEFKKSDYNTNIKNIESIYLDVNKVLEDIYRFSKEISLKKSKLKSLQNEKIKNDSNLLLLRNEIKSFYNPESLVLIKNNILSKYSKEKDELMKKLLFKEKQTAINFDYVIISEENTELESENINLDIDNDRSKIELQKKEIEENYNNQIKDLDDEKIIDFLINNYSINLNHIFEFNNDIQKKY